MLRLKRTLCACILVCGLVPTVAAPAATYYVATTGNNSNPGTSSQPWRTIAYAVPKMVAGDTTYVKGGTYSEGLIQFLKSGTQSAPIKLLNASGQFPIINFIDQTSTRQVVINNGLAWITIEGFEIRNGYVGIKINNGRNITIQRNWIHHHRSQGIHGNASTTLINGNKINHNGTFTGCGSCNQSHGIYITGTAVTVTNNVIYDNLAYGVVLNGSSALASNWLIANNTFSYNNYRGGLVVWGSQCHNARIENNTFHENGVKLASWEPQGIWFASQTCTGVSIRNNLAFASSPGATKFLGPGGIYTQYGNTVNTVKPSTTKLAAPTSLQIAN